MNFNVLFVTLHSWRCYWITVALLVLIFGFVPSSVAENSPTDIFLNQETGRVQQPLPEEMAELTLRDAVQFALLHNPELAAFAKEKRALKGITLQAGLLPNPELLFDIEDMGTRANSPGARFTSIRISQLIEIGGKRSARSRAASLGQEQAVQIYETKRLDLITQVANVFTDVLVGQERLRIADESKALAQKVVNTAMKRVQAGKAPPIEETKAKVAFATTKIELKQAQRELVVARKQLTLLWGNPMPKFKYALGNLESFVAIPDFSVLVARLRVNPTVLGSRINLEQRKALLELEKARRIPDITVNAGVRRYAHPHDTTALFAFSMPLPLFNRNQGNLLAAHQRVDKAMDDWAATDLQLRTLLMQAYEGLTAADNEIGTLRDEILPGAKAAFGIAQRGYELGKFGFLELLDAQRTLFQNRALYLRALVNYQRLVNEMERLIAAPIDSSLKSD
tara:strand:+ start:1493 stop:2851 length:1359 start_codon:yes stop_codon:yes gene_type:complete